MDEPAKTGSQRPRNSAAVSTLRPIFVLLVSYITLAGPPPFKVLAQFWAVLALPLRAALCMAAMVRP